MKIALKKNKHLAFLSEKSWHLVEQVCLVKGFWHKLSSIYGTIKIKAAVRARQQL